MMRNLVSLLCCAWAVAAALPSPEDYKVNGLDKYGFADESYAGHMPISLEDNKEGSLFFWLAKSRKSVAPGQEKLVIWLNGGPGCSSLIGMMHENGPFTIQLNADFDATAKEPKGEKYHLKRNPYSWTEVANVLYLEQPIRTGYSLAAEEAGPMKDEDQVATDFRGFLLSFIEIFKEFKGAEIFIAGESYAGFFVPWMSEHIVRKQLVTRPDGTTYRDKSDGINLVGVSIGNGVMDMFFQEPSYAEYAYYHGLIPLGAKVKFEKDWAACLESIEDADTPVTRASFDACNMMGKVLDAAGLPNEFDTSTFNQYAMIIGPDSAFNNFFQDPAIQAMIHVRGYDLPGLSYFHPEAGTIQQPAEGKQGHDGKKVYYEPPRAWAACNDAVDVSMAGDHPISVVPELQFLSQPTAPPATATSTSPSTARKLRSATTGTASPAVDAKKKKEEKGKTSDKKTDAGAASSTTTSATTTNTNSITDDSHAIRILLYSGEFDLNCNTLGTLHTLEANRWRNRAWSTADRSLWKYGDDVAGEYLSMDEMFSFLIVRNSGHLMPMDLPQISLDLIDRFINARTFADIPLPSEQSYLDAVLAGDQAEEQATAAAQEQGSLFVGFDSSMLGGAVLLFGLLVLVTNGWKTISGQKQRAEGQYMELPQVSSAAGASASYGALGQDSR